MLPTLTLFKLDSFMLFWEAIINFTYFLRYWEMDFNLMFAQSKADHK